MQKRTTIARNNATQTTYIVRLAILCLILASISACSTVRIGYEIAPRYAAWQLDRYWQLDSSQASFGKERIDVLWRWHQQSELPEYARWLRSLHVRLGVSVDILEVTSWRETAIRYWRAAALHMAPDLSELIVSLRPRQIEHMKQRMASDNDDYRREFLPEVPGERQAQSSPTHSGGKRFDSPRTI